MIEPLPSNTQAILLLTAPLISGGRENRYELLSLTEYNQLARLLRDRQKQPADLLAEDAEELITQCGQTFGRSRLETLLGRGFVLSQAVERWHTRAMWVMSRADPRYPKRLKIRLKEEAPPLLYGCGEVGLLEAGGLAVLGSARAAAEAVRYAQTMGKLSAEARRAIVSGGETGIGRAAIDGALNSGGEAVGVLADSLEQAALDRGNRQPLMQGRLVLVSPHDPGAGFQNEQALTREKLLYALADAAIVLTADFVQLEPFRFAPVYVRKGDSALLERGAQPWPEPSSAEELARCFP